MEEEPGADEAAALQRMIAELAPLRPEARRRIVDTVCTFFGLATAVRESVPATNSRSQPSDQSTTSFRFTEEEKPTPTVKRFLADKAPDTDVERVACLAFYLTHYRSTPHFKTKDISELNTEAAQRPFSNTSFAVENAAKTGYLVPSVKGSKQLSAAGEEFVEALPDRQAAREAIARARPKRAGSRRRLQSDAGDR